MLLPCLRKAGAKAEPNELAARTTLGVTAVVTAEREAPEPTWGMAAEHGEGGRLAVTAAARSKYERPEFTDQPSTLDQPGLQTWAVQAAGPVPVNPLCLWGNAWWASIQTRVEKAKAGRTPF